MPKRYVPSFQEKKILHRSFPDPSTFKGSEDQILDDVRQVRDEIKKMDRTNFCKVNGAITTKTN
jgi:hypothetical protein